MWCTIKRHGFDQEFEILCVAEESRIGAKLVVENIVKDITPQEEIDKEAFLKLSAQYDPS